MKYRKLRIAWSVIWGVVAVLLCVLWVRSYWSVAAVYCVISEQKSGSITLESARVCFLLHKWRNYIPPDFESPRIGYFFYEPPQTIGRLNKSNFSIVNNWGITELVLPTWFVVLFSVLLSVVPALPIKRFSLRTLLIVTTLIAVGLGAVAWLSR
jgi:hypothetical protein